MLKDELEKEIDKWAEKLDDRLTEIRPTDKHGKNILENAKAYRHDSEHFFENEDLIRSYESLIWAWAFIEIGRNLGHLSSSEVD